MRCCVVSVMEGKQLACLEFLQRNLRLCCVPRLGTGMKGDGLKQLEAKAACYESYAVDVSYNGKACLPHGTMHPVVLVVVGFVVTSLFLVRCPVQD